MEIRLQNLIKFPLLMIRLNSHILSKFKLFKPLHIYIEKQMSTDGENISW